MMKRFFVLFLLILLCVNFSGCFLTPGLPGSMIFYYGALYAVFGQQEGDTAIGSTNDEDIPIDKKLYSEFAYKTYARDPNRYKGKKVKAIVNVSQIMGSYSKAYRTYNYDGSTILGIDYNKEYIIYDCRANNAPKILKDDVIVVYGIFQGTEKMTRALTGTMEEILRIDMQDCDFIDISN